jgi:hypothetical protein
LIFLGSIGLLFFEPGWEPSLFALSSFSATIFSENHIRDHIKQRLRHFKAQNIKVSEGFIKTSDKELMKIFRQLCLDQNLDIKVINLDDDALEKFAKKKVNDEDRKYHLLAQVKRFKKKIDLCEQGIRKIAELYEKRLIRCNIDLLPIIARRYVSIVYPPMFDIDNSSFIERQKEIGFDIYSRDVIKGEISFMASIPNSSIDLILKKLKIKSTQEMSLPYMYSVLDIPESILYEYIVPNQVLSGLTRYKEIENVKFWAPQNWAIGPC